jgi:hypothetical protein
VSLSGVRVNSRAELERLFIAFPVRLVPVRQSRCPRPAHPEFVGPVHPDQKTKHGAIVYDEDGQASFNW